MQKEKKYLSELILKHMALHNLGQKEMAAKLNIKPSTLCSWLNPSGHGITRKHAEAIKFVCGDVMPEIRPDDSVSDALEKFRSGLISAFIDSQLSPDALQISLKIIKNFNLEK